jgi:hypothetical protein
MIRAAGRVKRTVGLQLSELLDDAAGQRIVTTNRRASRSSPSMLGRLRKTGHACVNACLGP